jgi:hypothetical protein
MKTTFKSIKEIKIGDVVKIAYKDEDSDSDDIFFIYDSIKEINVDGKYVITDKGYKVYGNYANDEWFKIVS